MEEEYKIIVVEIRTTQGQIDLLKQRCAECTAGNVDYLEVLKDHIENGPIDCEAAFPERIRFGK